MATCYTRRVQDSVPAFASFSPVFYGLAGIAAALAIFAVICLVAWHRRGAEGAPTRRAVLVATLVAVVGTNTAVFSFVGAMNLTDATRDRQVAAVTEAWDITTEDAEVLMQLPRAPFAMSAYVEIGGKTETARLHRQGDRLLLLRDDDTVIPTQR